MNIPQLFNQHQNYYSKWIHEIFEVHIDQLTAAERNDSISLVSIFNTIYKLSDIYFFHSLCCNVDIDLSTCEKSGAAERMLSA